LLIIRNRKDQNGRSGYTGTLAFKQLLLPGAQGTLLPMRCWKLAFVYEADNDPIGILSLTSTKGYVTDSWEDHSQSQLRVRSALLPLYPTYTQANNIANFDPSRYDPNQAVTVLPNGNIDPTRGGNRFNGLIRAEAVFDRRTRTG